MHLLPTRAEALAESLLSDECARQRLADSGYAELQQRIRTRAPPRPDATMPQRGRILGTAALPGPLPGMAAAARRPEVLSPPEEEEEVDDAQAEDVNAESGQEEREESRAEKRNRQERERYEAGAGTAARKELNRKKRERQQDSREQKKVAKQRAQGMLCGVVWLQILESPPSLFLPPFPCLFFYVFFLFIHR